MCEYNKIDDLLQLSISDTKMLGRRLLFYQPEDWNWLPEMIQVANYLATSLIGDLWCILHRRSKGQGRLWSGELFYH